MRHQHLISSLAFELYETELAIGDGRRGVGADRPSTINACEPLTGSNADRILPRGVSVVAMDVTLLFSPPLPCPIVFCVPVDFFVEIDRSFFVFFGLLLAISRRCWPFSSFS